MIHSDSPDPPGSWIWTVMKNISKRLKLYQPSIFLCGESFPLKVCNLRLRVYLQSFWPVLISSMKRANDVFPNKDKVSVEVMFVHSVVYWDTLGDKPFSKMRAYCSLLHCSLMDLTLANSQSLIYGQTAPEPGIYYPLLLSVRQHYITLHCSSQFAAAPPEEIRC